MLTLNVAKMKSIRKAKGLTQDQAAKRAGMTVSRWNDIEVGARANVTIRTLGMIALALKCGACELLAERQTKPRKDKR